MRIMKSWAVGLTAALAVLGTAGAATAVASTNDSSSSTSASQSTGSGTTAASGSSDKSSAAAADKKGSKDGAKRLCRHAPKFEKRLTHRLRKISDEGKGRGSTARLEKRIANAKKAGHDDIATYLTNRRDTRDAIAPKLKERKKDLGKVKSWCTAHHNGKS